MSATCPQPEPGQSQDDCPQPGPFLSKDDNSSHVRGAEFLGTDPDDLRVVPYEAPQGQSSTSFQGQKGKSFGQSQKGEKGKKGKGPGKGGVPVHYAGPDNTFHDTPPDGYKDVVCLA